MTKRRSWLRRALSSRLFQGGAWNSQGDHRVAEGHESRSEAPSDGRGLGTPPPQGWGSGGVLSPPGKFWNLRRNLVQLGAFWQEIDVSPAFHLCERKHYLSAWLWMPSVSCYSRRFMQWTCQLVFKTGTPPEGPGVDEPSPGEVTLFQGEFSTPTRWMDKPLWLGLNLLSSLCVYSISFSSFSCIYTMCFI